MDEFRLDLRMSLQALADGEATLDETFNDISAVVQSDKERMSAEIARLREAAMDVLERLTLGTQTDRLAKLRAVVTTTDEVTGREERDGCH